MASVREMNKPVSVPVVSLVSGRQVSAAADVIKSELMDSADEQQSVSDADGWDDAWDDEEKWGDMEVSADVNSRH